MMKPIDGEQKRSPVQFITITYDQADQRIDNFLIYTLKGMPKSRIYRLLRKGEVRVNKKRIGPDYRLMQDDVVRLPPVVLPEKAHLAPVSKKTSQLLTNRILFEDEHLIIINKPSGMSVHVGSTVRMGVIEAMRQLYPQYPQLELGHRLDSETSGCLILAKKKRVLREIHELLREGKIKKIYQALTMGHWQKKDLIVEAPLHKDYRDGGKHVVSVHSGGKTAHTRFDVLEKFKEAELMRVSLYTGRTHQIRVHATYKRHPIAGDDRYGDSAFNQTMRHLGLKRLFLHAHTVQFTLPSTKQVIKVEAPLDDDLLACLEALKTGD